MEYIGPDLILVIRDVMDKKKKAKRATDEETLEMLQALFMSRQQVINDLRKRILRLEYVVRRMGILGKLVTELPLDEKKRAKTKICPNQSK